MTRDEALTAPLSELRDWCAGEDGWTFEPHKTTDAGAVAGGWWKWVSLAPMKARTWCMNPPHPFPPTRDGAAKAMPEGWEWWKVASEWLAQAAHTPMIRVPDTGDEIDDRYRLAVLCRIAMKEASR